jgi:Ca2+:H+ antiporter
MAGDGHDANRMPWWGWVAPLAACGLITAKSAQLLPADAGPVLALAAVLLGAVVFSSVYHAEVLAIRVGEPFGAIILALAITIIEVGLILSIMVSGSAGSETVARDTVYATIMIVLNGVVGLSLVAGALRHREQEFRVEGASASLSVIITLAVIVLILPNFTLTVPGPFYAPAQLVFVGVVSLILYLLLVFVQTVRHPDYFILGDGADHGPPPRNAAVARSAALLVLSLVAVILLAKTLSSLVERSVASAGLPHAVVGIVIAAMVLLPEGMAALKAAKRNRLQSSLNASLGSVLASIGLTIPAVAIASLALGQPLVLGLGAEDMVLLMLTLVVSILTLATGRTTVLQGGVHLIIFCIFLFLSAVP